MSIDENLIRSLDEPAVGGILPLRLRLVEALKVQPANDPSVRLFLRLLADPEVLVQQLAVVHLKPRRDIIRELLSELITLLGHHQERTRWSVCELLSELGPEASAALQKIEGFENNVVVARAIWKLSERGDLVSPRLIRLLEEKPRWREEVCYLIYEMGPAAAPVVPTLIRCLGEPDAHADGDQTWPVVEALGAVGPDAAEAVPSLVSLLSNQSSAVAGSAARALGRIGGAAVPALIPALQSEDSSTREFAGDALAPIRDVVTAAIPHLQRLLKDGDPDLAAWTVFAMARITKDRALAPLLREALDRTSNESVKAFGRQTLDSLKDH